MANLSDQFKLALSITSTDIVNVKEHTPRPIYLVGNSPITIPKFIERLLKDVAASAAKIPDLVVLLASKNEAEVLRLAVSYFKSTRVEVPVADSIKNSILLQHPTAKDEKDRFYVVYKDGGINTYDGPDYFMAQTGISRAEAIQTCRAAYPEYDARNPVGFSTRTVDGRTEEKEFFNIYQPPPWLSYEGDLPDELPELFEKFIQHLIPIPVEREYLFAWIYRSLESRAFVYLVLCGAPGAGKNTLKKVMRALHGEPNTVDGKHSTITGKFNGQLFRNTLTWFDEIKYKRDNENTLKELQNDTLSEERKGVDATMSSKLFASMVLSNNAPTDNYIAFDGRKFVPLVVGATNLNKFMTPNEIDRLVTSVENSNKPGYNLAFIAQIGRYIMKHGAEYAKRWPNLEYRGPAFYLLAHQSLAKWQKLSIRMLLDADDLRGRTGIQHDDEKGFLWSGVFNYINKKHKFAGQVFADFSLVQHFFDNYRDNEGHRIFRTVSVKNDPLSDFWVKHTRKKFSLTTFDEIVSATELSQKAYLEKASSRKNKKVVEDAKEEDDDFGASLL